MGVEKRVKIFKALADASRLKIINALFEKPQYVEELAQRLDLASSTVSHHLKKLEEIGLVEKQKEQYYVMYYVQREFFHATLQSIVCFQNPEKIVQEQRIRNYREKVMKTFFSSRKVEKLPSQLKKRLIILEEIATSFTPEKVYTESEVNSIIRPFHDDYCRVRREMIDNGIMNRKSGMYQRAGGKNSLKDIPTAFIEKQRETRINKRKALKKTYLETYTPPGVLKITNLVNGKIYLAANLNVNALLTRNKVELRMGWHRNEELVWDFKEFGVENFTFEVLEYVEENNDPQHNYHSDVARLLDLWLEKLQPYGEKGYNKPSQRK